MLFVGIGLHRPAVEYRHELIGDQHHRPRVRDDVVHFDDGAAGVRQADQDDLAAGRLRIQQSQPQPGKEHLHTVSDHVLHQLARGLAAAPGAPGDARAFRADIQLQRHRGVFRCPLIHRFPAFKMLDRKLSLRKRLILLINLPVLLHEAGAQSVVDPKDLVGRPVQVRQGELTRQKKAAAEHAGLPGAALFDGVHDHLWIVQLKHDLLPFRSRIV